MLLTPFYDPKKSYEENYKSGPLGAFADGQIINADQKLINPDTIFSASK